MATTNADEYNTKAFKGTGRQLCVLDVTHEATTTELGTAGNVIQLGVVPKGAIYVDGYIATDDLDTHGTTQTLVLEVGDEDDPNGLMAGGTTGQAAAVTEFNGTVLTNKTESAREQTIAVTVATAAGLATAGTIRVVLYYYVL